MKIRLGLGVIGAGLVIGVSAADDLDLKWSGACAQVESFVNGIFDATRTTCVPAGYRAKRGILMLFADGAVFSVPAARKAWLFSVVGGVGLVMNEARSLACVDVVLGDSEGIEQNRGYSLSCQLVKDTQRDVKSGKLTIDDAWQRIDGALKPVKKPKS